MSDLGQAGEKCEGSRRAPSTSQVVPTFPTGPQPPRAPFPTEGRDPHSRALSRPLPGPHLYQSHLPPCSYRDRTLLSPRTSRRARCVLPAKFSLPQFPAPTAPADHLPSGVPAHAAPPRPGWDESEVSGYATLSISFCTFLDWWGKQCGAIQLSPTPNSPVRSPPAPQIPRDFRRLQKGGGNPPTKRPWDRGRVGSQDPQLVSRPSVQRSPGPASRILPWPLGPRRSPPRPAPPKPTPSPRAFRAPAAGADSPCTPAPSPTSTAGKNQVGGRGKAGAAGQIAVAQPTSAARWGL